MKHLFRKYLMVLKLLKINGSKKYLSKINEKNAFLFGAWTETCLLISLLFGPSSNLLFYFKIFIHLTIFCLLVIYDVHVVDICYNDKRRACLCIHRIVLLYTHTSIFQNENSAIIDNEQYVYVHI